MKYLLVFPICTHKTEEDLALNWLQLILPGLNHLLSRRWNKDKDLIWFFLKKKPSSPSSNQGKTALWIIVHTRGCKMRFVLGVCLVCSTLFWAICSGTSYTWWSSLSESQNGKTRAENHLEGHWVWTTACSRNPTRCLFMILLKMSSTSP